MSDYLKKLQERADTGRIRFAGAVLNDEFMGVEVVELKRNQSL